MSTKPNKRGENRESTWKKIQKDDSQDDPKFWKQMELQVSRLETRIEKMQEMFNKDIEEIRESINNE